MKNEIVLFGTFRVNTNYVFIDGDMFLVRFDKFAPVTLGEYIEQTKVDKVYPNYVALSDFTGTLYFTDANQYKQFNGFMDAYQFDGKFKTIALDA